MKTWTLRLGLSLMVMVSCWTTRLPAQEVLVVPATHYEPGYQGPPTYPFMPRPKAQTADHLMHRLLKAHGLACQADPYFVTCGNLHTEMNFAFGSCRSFFGQDCIPGQPCFDKHRQR